MKCYWKEKFISKSQCSLSRLSNHNNHQFQLTVLGLYFFPISDRQNEPSKGNGTESLFTDQFSKMFFGSTIAQQYWSSLLKNDICNMTSGRIFSGDLPFLSHLSIYLLQFVYELWSEIYFEKMICSYTLAYIIYIYIYLSLRKLKLKLKESLGYPI